MDVKQIIGKGFPILVTIFLFVFWLLGGIPTWWPGALSFATVIVQWITGAVAPSTTATALAKAGLRKI